MGNHGIGFYEEIVEIIFSDHHIGTLSVLAYLHCKPSCFHWRRSSVGSPPRHQGRRNFAAH